LPDDYAFLGAGGGRHHTSLSLSGHRNCETA
jgi:hypothetical protein